MDHREMVNLIAAGIEQPGGIWADFGAGRGNFTVALRDCVGAHATVYAVDKNKRDLNALHKRWPDNSLHLIEQDFRQPVTLPSMDGILMANALHWNRDHVGLLNMIRNYLKPGGIFLIVEYEVQRARPYIPMPVPYASFQKMATSAGYTAVEQVGYRTSPRDGLSMYAAVARRETD